MRVQLGGSLTLLLLQQAFITAGFALQRRPYAAELLAPIFIHNKSNIMLTSSVESVRCINGTVRVQKLQNPKQILPPDGHPDQGIDMQDVLGVFPVSSQPAVAVVEVRSCTNRLGSARL
jgi:hypothetical protein